MEAPSVVLGGLRARVQPAGRPGAAAGGQREAGHQGRHGQ